jgi:hypothetical protein
MRKESFHLLGKTPLVRDELKMCKSGDLSPFAQCLTKDCGIPSSPGPLLISNPAIAVSISEDVSRSVLNPLFLGQEHKIAQSKCNQFCSLVAFA